MDNVTHTLIGVALGHVIVRAVPKVSETPKMKPLVFWTSILANNAPDTDIFLPRLFRHFIGEGRLTSLLQHRGFTHTILAAPVLGILSLGVAWLLSGAPRMTRTWFKWFYGLAILGVLCHLGADYWNDYGIHPFSPFYNRWFYGDSIFIVEPLIWFSILPLAFFGSKKVLIKGLTVLVSAVMIGLLLFGPYVPFLVALAACTWFFVAWQLQKFANKSWKRDRRNYIPAVSLLVLVLAFFMNGSRHVRAELTDILAQQRPGEKIVQFARSPAPADPFCWKTLIVTEGPGDRYTIRSATVSLLPRWVNSTSCLKGLESEHSIDLSPTALPAQTPRGYVVTWKGEFSREYSELGRLGSEFCQFNALREFARAPFWTHDEDGWIAGDFRYDRGRGAGFSNVRFATRKGAGVEDTPCPQVLPGWIPPVE